MAGSRWAPAPRGDVAAAMPASGLQRQVGLHGEDDQAARRRKQGEDDEAEQFALAEVHLGLEAGACSWNSLSAMFIWIWSSWNCRRSCSMSSMRVSWRCTWEPMR